MRALCLILLLATAARADLRTDTLSEHVVLEDSAAAPAADLPLTVTLDSKLAVPTPDLLAALIRRRLDQAKVDYQFAAGTPLAPRLFVTVSEQAPAAVVLELFLVEYVARETRYVPKVTWERKHVLDHVPASEREETIGRLLQKEMAQFVSRSGALSPVPDVSHAAHARVWRDTESESSLYSLGATAGTLLPLGLRAGIWGSVDFPVTFGIGGMYFSPSMRGFQADAGWAWDRAGKVKQVVGLTFAKYNETRTESSTVPLERGRTATRTETIERLRTYVGPHYVVQWSDFFFQAAALFPAEAGAGRATRLLVQIGYVPLWF